MYVRAEKDRSYSMKMSFKKFLILFTGLTEFCKIFISRRRRKNLFAKRGELFNGLLFIPERKQQSEGEAANSF